MKQSIKSKIILFTLVFVVIFAVTLFFATNSFATEEVAEADSASTTAEEVAANEEITEALPEATEATEATEAESSPQANLDMVETPLGETGLKLIGEREALATTDYTVNDSQHNIHILTDNWILTGSATHPYRDGWRIILKCNLITLKDLTQVDNKTNIFLDADVGTNTLIINIDGNNNIWSIASDRSIEFIGNGTLNVFGNYEGRATGIAGVVYFQNGSLTINGPQIIINNEVWASEVPIPLMIEEGDLNLNSGKLISIQELNEDDAGVALVVAGELNISDEAELYCSGKYLAISPTLNNNYGDESKYKTSSDFLTYEQKSLANRAAKVVQVEVETGIFAYEIMLDDGVTGAKTVYKPSANTPVPPQPTPPEPTPAPEELNAAQTGDSPLAGIVMMIAVASGFCFVAVNVKRTLKNRA